MGKTYRSSLTEKETVEYKKKQKKKPFKSSKPKYPNRYE